MELQRAGHFRISLQEMEATLHAAGVRKRASQDTLKAVGLPLLLLDQARSPWGSKAMRTTLMMYTLHFFHIHSLLDSKNMVRHQKLPDQ